MDPKCYLGALQTPWYSNKILSDVKSDKNFIADPRGFEPLISSVTGRRVKPGYTMGPLLFISIF